MLDLNQFDTTTRANEGVDCALRDLRTGKPTEAVITLRGLDSEAFRDIKTERARETARRMEAGLSPELTPDEKDALTADTLSKLTVGWRGLALAGKELEFSQSEAFKLYLRYPAIREQVNAFAGDRANFALA